MKTNTLFFLNPILMEILVTTNCVVEERNQNKRPKAPENKLISFMTNSKAQWQIQLLFPMG